MSLRRTSFVGKNEAGTNPDAGSTQHHSCGQRLAIEETTGSNSLDWLASEFGNLLLAQLCDSRDQDRCRDITSVSTTLATLSADDVHIEIEAFLDMLGVSDHIHVEDAVLVKLIHDFPWWHTNSRNEELATGVDDDVDEGW